MPKPRTEAREQRRAARDIARRWAIGAVEHLLHETEPHGVFMGGPDALAAYQAEVRRIVERMRLQYRLRVEHAPRSDLALGDTPAADEPG